MKCRTCKYFKERQVVYRDGDCRGHAPTVTTLTVTTDKYMENHTAAWPQVDIDDWCGDYIDKDINDPCWEEPQ